MEIYFVAGFGLFVVIAMIIRIGDQGIAEKLGQLANQMSIRNTKLEELLELKYYQERIKAYNAGRDFSEVPRSYNRQPTRNEILRQAEELSKGKGIGALIRDPIAQNRAARIRD